MWFFKPPNAEEHTGPFNVENKAAGRFAPSDDRSDSWCSGASLGLLLAHGAYINSNMHVDRLLHSSYVVA